MPRNGSQLTDTQVRNLPAPAAGQAQFPDGKIPGFGLRVTAAGVKTFYFTYRYRYVPMARVMPLCRAICQTARNVDQIWSAPLRVDR